MNPNDHSQDPELRTAGASGGSPADAEPRDFSTLYDRIAPSLFAWSRLRLLPELRQRLDPEDIVQEVCYRSYENFASFSPERACFRSWLFGIANNVLLEELKKLRKQPGSTSKCRSSHVSAIDEVVDTMTRASQRVARDEEFQRLLAEIERLDATDRQIVALRGIEGLKHADVATHLGLTPDSVEKRWQRLKKELEARHFPDGFLAEH